MELKKLFYKNIERDIKGVIKIGQDDDANVFQELDEYVVTRELAKHFSTFFDAYKKSIGNHTDKMGVWITGFFGSGKSHFLKILSYLLENREVRGKKAVSFFDDKIKDPIVLADIQKAGGISTDVILFNIDSKSDSDTRTNKEAILKVFNKVFNEMQGFCGSLPWLADLERRMQLEGNYEAFKNSFQQHSGHAWIDAREDIYFEEESIVKALAETTRMSEESARRWYQNAEENYSLSVEKFANQLKEYIEAKGHEHHVIFLVDEMGQYIGDDSGLLLNLQTVVEDLGTYCGGKAWVVATSQQDIDSITRVRGYDFSKILARFDTRLSLSSANVDEVIKRRILYKNDLGRDTLKLLYSEKEAILKNLITFTSGTPEMKIYQDTEDFIAIYPFVPYQFKLLQAVFTAVRQHGASGKHLAEGERSLLSAFQEAAQKYAGYEVGVVIPFSAFYETIETFLDHNIRTVFIHAEDNQNLQPIDIEVLKILFMIKWVKEMPATMENVATLMVNHIDDDLINKKKEVEASLDRLLKETLIQKNGNEYLFLTHEEQDVNREIQNIPVDLGEVVKNIGEEILSSIYSERRFRYSARYHFDFNKTIDDRHLTAPNRHEIGVKIITPYYDPGKELNDADLKMMASRENSLVINLHDTYALGEMEEIYKIQTYLTRRGGSSDTPEIEDIKGRKGRELTERKERVTELLKAALKDADFYANSQKINLRTANPVERFNEGLKVLVDSIYHKLSYIDTHIESNADLIRILDDSETQGTLDLSDATPNNLALNEMISYIDNCDHRNMIITMKSLLDHFSKAPYGWLHDDIRGVVLKLFKSQEIKLIINQEHLHPGSEGIVQYTVRREHQDRLVIKKRDKVPPELIQNAKMLIRELFNITVLPSDEDGTMIKFKEHAQIEVHKLDRLLVHYEKASYPGERVLEQGKALFEGILQVKDILPFFEKLSVEKDNLLTYEEQSASVKNFFKNQSNYFDKALDTLQVFDKNKTYIVDPEVINIVEEIKMIVNAEEPYSSIPRLPELIKYFNDQFIKLLNKEIEPVKDVVESDRQKILNELEEHSLKDELFTRFDNRFKDLLSRLNSCNNFYEAIAMKEESDRIKLLCFGEIETKLQEVSGEQGIEYGPEVTTSDEDKPKPPQKKVVQISVRNLFHGAGAIDNEEDIEKLLSYLRQELKQKLEENTRLKLI